MIIVVIALTNGIISLMTGYNYNLMSTQHLTMNALEHPAQMLSLGTLKLYISWITVFTPLPLNTSLLVDVVTQINGIL